MCTSVTDRMKNLHQIVMLINRLNIMRSFYQKNKAIPEVLLRFRFVCIGEHLDILLSLNHIGFEEKYKKKI